MSIREEMPVLARHAGEWTGTYTLIDTSGKILDHHQSHLSCQLPEDGPYPYYQVNRYTWADGKEEVHNFPGTYQDKILWFDSDRIQGKAWEIDDSTVILWFSYKTAPGMYLYEMIQISPDNNHRARTWHWFKNDQIYQRTLIQEERLK
ncbi:DUF3598 family protein [Anabaena sp. FACHB-709]|uniref:DUF3598 domain-containing protein n=2 Tax=Nostocaceae TaxID=1162 RepID=A0A1Z4KNQ1_ANAVA|nr:MULTISPECIES: DUF3598 family protein [Nostocaceae]BAY70619.1 hypothetical protein NIES23_34260 [Trichormus variabilis NIES-23]HBW32711.1 DUF3598 domain-containing protein [Nostoc sp. UBA8866]MBD2172583.1 DUF3598 family protein [Anabaena cylindrica FACHB-318]MBD2264445.1 DUF3598 family protein [Anabaena sp. FACHB-709]MBD2274216.1 DUF3598 family protein [Nostoc sp. PCC 7120 = FACHB-418]